MLCASITVRIFAVFYKSVKTVFFLSAVVLFTAWLGDANCFAVFVVDSTFIDRSALLNFDIVVCCCFVVSSVSYRGISTDKSADTSVDCRSTNCSTLISVDISTDSPPTLDRYSDRYVDRQPTEKSADISVDTPYKAHDPFFSSCSQDTVYPVLQWYYKFTNLKANVTGYFIIRQ